MKERCRLGGRTAVARLQGEPPGDFRLAGGERFRKQPCGLRKEPAVRL
jgi:hypothetical protein